MNLVETKQLLIRASAVDNRVVSDLAVAAWQEVLADIEYEQAVAALVVHRRERPDVYVQPGHLLAVIRANDELDEVEAEEQASIAAWLRRVGMSEVEFAKLRAEQGLVEAIEHVNTRRAIGAGS